MTHIQKVLKLRDLGVKYPPMRPSAIDRITITDLRRSDLGERPPALILDGRTEAVSLSNGVKVVLTTTKTALLEALTP